MTREIKFRAWEKPSTEVGFEGKMHYGIDEYFHKWHGHKDYEVMQFTGLLDKNGKEIYEGDVIDFEYRSGLWEVKFGEQEISHDWIGIGFFLSQENNVNGIYNKCGEVIGNIYENPNLLQEKLKDRK